MKQTGKFDCPQTLRTFAYGYPISVTEAYDIFRERIMGMGFDQMDQFFGAPSGFSFAVRRRLAYSKPAMTISDEDIHNVFMRGTGLRIDSFAEHLSCWLSSRYQRVEDMREVNRIAFVHACKEIEKIFDKAGHVRENLACCFTENDSLIFRWFGGYDVRHDRLSYRVLRRLQQTKTC